MMMTEYDPQQAQREQQQREQQQRATMLERGRAIRLMRNGDSFFQGRSFVINQRKYPMLEVFLDDASQTLHANFGAVRSIYTPKNGTRLRDISDFEDHRTYVAGGRERFKKLHYLDIADGKRVTAKDRTSPKLPPVKRLDVEGRALKLSRSENVIIYVYRNGDPLTLPSKILLVKPTLQNWESVLDEITRKVSLTSSAVLKLYAMNGELITSAQQLEYNGMYVAAGKERFKRIDYPDPKLISPNSSPKMSRKSDHPSRLRLPLRQMRVENYNQHQQPPSGMFHTMQRRYSKSDGTNTHTTTATSHGSTDIAGQRRPVREEYDFFNNKPQQHRRGPTRETDLDRDDGGIYKGRSNYRERVREIDETRDTKVDLPVDYREVETVDEENLYGNAGRTPRRHQQPPSQPKILQALVDPRQRSPPPVRAVKSPSSNYDDSRYGMNNGHHQNNNINGFGNEFHRRTPVPIDDDIPTDRTEEQQLPHSSRHQQLISSGTQPKKNDEEQAATVIQSHVRGYLARKQSHHEKQPTDQLTNDDHSEQHQELAEKPKDDEEKHQQPQQQQQPQSVEFEQNIIEPIADLTVQQALIDALAEGGDKEEKDEPRHDYDDEHV